MIIYLVIFLTLFTCPAEAEWSANTDTGGYSIENAVAEDPSAFYYRGGVDYQPKVTTPDPSIGFSVISGTMGCSGFNFASSFNSVFNEQALTDYMKNVSSAAIASAPNLLLQMLSPSLYDFIKNISMLTQQRLNMRYQQCEDIEADAGGYIAKLRKKSEKECLDAKQKEGTNIDTAIRFCKEQHDPFGFLKDSEGKTIASGGKIDVIGDLLKKASIPKEKQNKVLEVTGDTEIDKNNVKDKPPQKDITQDNEKNRQDAYDILVLLMEHYREDGTVSKEELEKLSKMGMEVTEQEIKEAALASRAKRRIALAKLSSDIAFMKTVRDYKDILLTLQTTMQQPNLDDVEKEALKNRYDFVSSRLDTFIEERDMQREHNDTINSIFTEVEEEKLKTIANADSTDSYFVEDAERRDKIESYMPVKTEESKQNKKE